MSKKDTSWIIIPLLVVAAWWYFTKGKLGVGKEIMQAATPTGMVKTSETGTTTPEPTAAEPTRSKALIEEAGKGTISEAQVMDRLKQMEAEATTVEEAVTTEQAIIDRQEQVERGHRIWMEHMEGQLRDATTDAERQDIINSIRQAEANWGPPKPSELLSPDIHTMVFG